MHVTFFSDNSTNALFNREVEDKSLSKERQTLGSLKILKKKNNVDIKAEIMIPTL